MVEVNRDLLNPHRKYKLSNINTSDIGFSLSLLAEENISSLEIDEKPFLTKAKSS